LRKLLCLLAQFRRHIRQVDFHAFQRSTDVPTLYAERP
jgi:hypothetical protein